MTGIENPELTSLTARLPIIVTAPLPTGPALSDVTAHDNPELFGPAALAQDIEIRTIGLRRAAERSAEAVSEETRLAFEAYADGVNAYIAAHAPPPEYALLEITTIEPWTPVDSIAFG